MAERLDLQHSTGARQTAKNETAVQPRPCEGQLPSFRSVEHSQAYTLEAFSRRLVDHAADKFHGPCHLDLEPDGARGRIDGDPRQLDRRMARVVHDKIDQVALTKPADPEAALPVGPHLSGRRGQPFQTESADDLRTAPVSHCGVSNGKTVAASHDALHGQLRNQDDVAHVEPPCPPARRRDTCRDSSRHFSRHSSCIRMQRNETSRMARRPDRDRLDAGKDFGEPEHAVVVRLRHGVDAGVRRQEPIHRTHRRRRKDTLQAHQGR